MQPIYSFQTAKQIIAGKESLKRLKDDIKLVSKNINSALIISQPSISDLGFVGTIKEQLEDQGIYVNINLDILPEPTVENIEDVFQQTSNTKYDVLIGIGGGSVLDTTKILSVLMTNDKQVRELLGTDMVEKAGVPTSINTNNFWNWR